MNKYKQMWLAAAVVAAVGWGGAARAADEQRPPRPEGCTCCPIHCGPGGAMQHGPGPMRGHGPEEMRGPGPMGIFEGMRQAVTGHILEQLDVTAEQKEKIKEIGEQHKDDGKAAFEKIMTERMALQKLIMADTLDEKAIREQSAKLATLEADAAVARAKVSQEIREVLTPEQVQKAKDMQAQFEARMKERGPMGERREKR